MSLVVDASVAIKWYVREELHEEAASVLDQEQLLFAPDLIVAEVTNAAWKKVRRSEIDRAMAERIGAEICSGVPLLYSCRHLNARALQISLFCKHPIYDCYYLACAELIGGILVTNDRRLHGVVANSELAERVKLLEDIARPGQAL